MLGDDNYGNNKDGNNIDFGEEDADQEINHQKKKTESRSERNCYYA